MNEEEKKLLEANLGGLEMYRKGFQDGWLTNPQNPDNTANAEVRRQLLEQEILHWDRRLIAIFESLISLHDKKLGEYLHHKENCILSQFEGGRVTEDGYEQQFAGKWYEIRPVDRTPKCDCGLVELLAAQVIEGKESQ